MTDLREGRGHRLATDGCGSFFFSKLFLFLNEVGMEVIG